MMNAGYDQLKNYEATHELKAQAIIPQTSGLYSNPFLIEPFAFPFHVQKGKAENRAKAAPYHR
ncbi:hypothetical protein ACH33_16980 [Aneurinibacillus sp. XH2]|uniref:hypothetical protein n=1 Tax=Aneurinibacillus TaxID=55079 RepID=UPI00070A7CEF|nr:MULTISPECIES: hypothetical protein [Aneurinibacillus]AMA74336.1 hypothetical protein ACH33_16980 [Aneurinibacillus sp. XH2]MED0678741.1 hypothetical protein [Aneurinibacillus thermoaerophilus]